MSPPAVAAAVGACVVLVLTTLCAGIVGGVVGAPSSAVAPVPAGPAAASIPPDMVRLYVSAAATCPGLEWTVLAGVGEVETDHGRSRLPGVTSGANAANARGPMQFLPGTFAAVVRAHPPPPGGASPPSPYNPSDAVHAAAMYLCDNGARGGRDIRRALFTYNHSDAYVDSVLSAAARYTRGTGPPPPPPAGPATGPAATPGSRAAATAVLAAMSQIGTPYVWGGDGPAAGDGGFDCSGLTRAAYAAAGITLPRTADAQYRAGPGVPATEPTRPGDLVFYGTRAHVHHVGIALDSTRMINAPDVGKRVQIGDVRWPGDDYLGATRPAG